ncbi:MAG: hypothetical protein IT376_21690 [Polyangiaceae bacterium]|nr:hypothetical protein [Polyangiaceae bacterium]
MRARRLSLLASIGLATLAIAALAQPKRGSKPKAADTAASASAAPAPASASAEPPAPTESATPREPRPSPELGDAPPPATSRPKTQPSPLDPAPEELPDAGPHAPPVNYEKLMGEITALRGRVAALTTTLFASRLRVVVQVEGDDARTRALRVTLDDGVVFQAPERFVAEDEKTVYEHAVAPGHHVLGIEIERNDARGKQWVTQQTTRFSVVVPEGKRVEALLRVEDDSDMAESFPEDQDGEYDLRVRLRARVAAE